MIVDARASEVLGGPAMMPVLAEVSGIDARDLVWSVHATNLRPDGEINITYRCAHQKRSKVTFIIASTNPHYPGQRYLVGGHDVLVWQHAYDPALPGLAPALSPRQVAAWLGWPTCQVSLVAYRPLRRAVVHASFEGLHRFLKIVTPSRGRGLAKRYQLLAGLAPSLVARPMAGVIIVNEAHGTRLSSVLKQHRPVEARSFVDLLDAFPDSVRQLSARPSWCDNVDFYAQTFTNEAMADVAKEIARDVTWLIAHSEPGPVVATHGDFYEANIYFSEQGLSVIDLDSAGPGFRVDDYACLLGHVSTLQQLGEFDHVGTYIDAWLREFEHHCDPVSLRARAAGVVLSLTSSPYPRNLNAKFALAQLWRDLAFDAR